MSDAIKQALKGMLTEMAAPKLPDGMKKKRDDIYAGVHHIEIGGKHVATIVGHKPDKYSDRYIDHKQKVGHQTEYGKQYTVYKNKPTWSAEHGNNDPATIHPDHSVEVEKHEYGNGYGQPATSTHKVRLPHVHGSMESAMEAIHTQHSLKSKFGNMTQEQRWQKAADMHASIAAHNAKNSQYMQAHTAMKNLGHHDIADKIHTEWEAHKAAKPHVDQHDLAALANGASQYSYMSQHHNNDIERHHLARRALGQTV